MKHLALALALTACAGTPGPRPDGPPPTYPGTLIAPADLRSPSALGDAFALEQTVRSISPEGTHQFRAVLQRRGAELVLVGFGPHGGRGFVLRHEGDDVSFESHLPEALPFPPRFMLHDIQRVWFRGLEGPREDGTHTETIDDETVTERWVDGRLRERTFERPGTDGVIRVDYGEGLGGDAPPDEVVLENGWFGYRLVLRTLSHQRIDE